MAANIQMVLYRCKNRVKPWPPIRGVLQDDVYKMELLVNEAQEFWPFKKCERSILCPLKDILDEYDDKKCDEHTFRNKVCGKFLKCRPGEEIGE